MSQLDLCNTKYNFDIYQNSTNFSIEELDQYCTNYISYDHLKTGLDFTIGLFMAIIGAIGFFNCVLTFITFSNRTFFTGPSFFYHKAIALIELIHMVVMCDYGILLLLNFPGGYGIMIWRYCLWNGWIFGDAVKLCVTCLTVFVSLERTIAIWLPLKFDRINKYSIAMSATIMAFLISSLQLNILGAFYVDTTSEGVVSCRSTTFGQSVAYDNIQYAIYVLELMFSSMTFAMCVAIALGMYIKNKKSAAMSQDNKNRWQLVKMACYLQMIVAVSGLIDRMAWVAFRLIASQAKVLTVGSPALILSYDKAKQALNWKRWLAGIEFTQVMTGVIDHAGRFYFYLIFQQRFRDSFKDIWKRLNKTKVQAINITHDQS